MKVGQIERDEGPESHLKKQGTPTMGGIVIALGIIIGFAICVSLINYYDRDKFKIVLTLPFLITSVKYIFDIQRQSLAKGIKTE